MAAKSTAPTIQRLAIIKHLFSRSIEQSLQGPPMDGLALLGMHDAAEMFLVLACEVNETEMPVGHRMAKRVTWHSYWNYLAPLGPEHRIAMSRLNKARVALKHQGLLPSPLDLEGHRVTCRNFFEDNTPILFGVSLGSVSLVDLVNNDKTKRCVCSAIGFKTKRKYGDAIVQAATAFFWLLDDYRRRPETVVGRVLVDLRGSSIMAYGDDVPDDVSSAIDDLSYELDEVRSAFTMVAVGIDCRQWARFNAITPIIHRGAPLETKHNSAKTERLVAATREDADFCIEFVIQSALRLQDQA